MKTFVNFLLIVAVLLLAIKLWPVVAFILGAMGLALSIGGGLLGLTLGGAFALIATLLAVALVIALVLSPLWLPVLAVVGIVALVRRSSPRTA